MRIKRKIQNKIKELVSHSQAIKEGRIGTYREVAKTLRELHILQALSQTGVKKPTDLTNSELGIIGTILKRQYYQGKDELTGKRYGLKYLLKDAIEKDLSVKMIEHRLNLFAKASEITKHMLTQRKQIFKGATQKRRVLGKTHDHCNLCLYYASLGWQRIEDAILPLPTQRCDCKANCVCSMEYK